MFRVPASREKTTCEFRRSRCLAFAVSRRLAAASRSDLAAASALSVAARRAFSAGDGKSTRASIYRLYAASLQSGRFFGADRNTTGCPGNERVPPGRGRRTIPRSDVFGEDQGRFTKDELLHPGML